MSEWCYPVLNGAGIKKHQYSVQTGTGFLDPRYWEARHMQHTGCDFNAVTGGDSDFGDPVYSVSKGLVESVGYYRGWGWIVVIYHETANVRSMYAHFKQVEHNVKSGSRVTCGQIIGSIGKGDRNQFWAHLHFEIRNVVLSPSEWPSNTLDEELAYQFILKNYTDPLKFLKKVKAVRAIDQLST